jgi:aspartate kinase
LGRDGTDGILNSLLRAAKAAEVSRGTKNWNEIVNQIQEDHIGAAQQTIKSPELLASYTDQVKAECKNLAKILESAQHLEEVSRGVENKIISKGEKLACRYMTTLLLDRDVPAQFVDLSDVFKRYNVPDLKQDGAYKELAVALGQEVLLCGDKVPIITGYFGHVPEGLLHSIGRGYTDLCAALVAIGTSAQELQIWKEVDGIFTADPRKVPTARLLPNVSPSEAAELTVCEPTDQRAWWCRCRFLSLALICGDSSYYPLLGLYEMMERKARTAQPRLKCSHFIRFDYMLT